MKKTDKLIIDFDYTKSDIHFTDEQMEGMVNNWMNSIMNELNDVRSKLNFNAMSLTSIHVKNIVRKSQIK